MASLTTTIVALLINGIYSFSTDWTSEFDYYTYLDENQLFRLYWSDLENDIMDFGIEAEANGWIALGVSPNGQMPGSDIAIGWVDDNGNTYLQDRYTEGRTTPLLDPHQNITLIESEEVDGMTRIRFTRPKYTCNVNDIQLSQGTTRIIWAFHETADPTKEFFDSSSITMHTNKGSQSLNLDSGVQLPIELEDDIEYIDVLMDNAEVPSADTTYYCKLFKLPDLNDTVHIVKFEPIVEDGNEGLVHHLIAYSCDATLVRDGDAGHEGPCDEAFENMPSRECLGSQLIYAWAVGAEDLYLPENVGLPLGGNKGSKYILMEMHYDNPLERSDLVDSSGFRMTITPTLRSIDAGFFNIGSWTNMLGHYIPPGLPFALNRAFMYGECSQGIFPETGINIFTSGLHQHTIGVASSLRIIRDGQELEPIDSNWNYDFNYQNGIYFEEPKVILPGDTLILDCYYDSTGRNVTTYGGQSTREEMCFDFFLYYPAVDFFSASSAKYEYSLYQWMTDAKSEGYLTGDVDAAWGEYGDFDILSYDSSIDGAIEFYDRLWDPLYPEYDSNHIHCYGSNGTILYDVRTQPTDFIPYQEDIFVCDDNDETNDIETTQSDTTTEALIEENEATSIGNICIVFILGFLGFVFV